MASFFLDTSAAVKRYVQETGTAWFRALTDPANGHYLYLVRITDVEITSAIARCRKGTTLTVAKAATALNQFRLDFAQDYRIIEVAIPLLQKASQLADLHALAYDSVQLAAALEVRATIPSLTLLSADNDLNAAATAEGLPVDNPNWHP